MLFTMGPGDGMAEAIADIQSLFKRNHVFDEEVGATCPASCLFGTNGGVSLLQVRLYRILSAVKIGWMRQRLRSGRSKTSMMVTLDRVNRVDMWMGDEKSGFDILRRWISRAMRPFPLSDTSTGTRIVQA